MHDSMCVCVSMQACMHGHDRLLCYIKAASVASICKSRFFVDVSGG